jgi:DNA-binding response OmpR family regulator
VFKPGYKILTDEETAILKFLKRVEGATISREKLLNEVWGYNANVPAHILEKHVYRLRQKIESDPSKTKIILTGSGGYSMANS